MDRARPSAGGRVIARSKNPAIMRIPSAPTTRTALCSCRTLAPTRCSSSSSTKRADGSPRTHRRSSSSSTVQGGGGRTPPGASGRALCFALCFVCDDLLARLHTATKPQPGPLSRTWVVRSRQRYRGDRVDAVTERKEVELCVGIVGNIAMPTSISRLQLDRYSRPAGVETRRSVLQRTRHWVSRGQFTGPERLVVSAWVGSTIRPLSASSCTNRDYRSPDWLPPCRHKNGCCRPFARRRIGRSDCLRGRQNSLRLCVQFVPCWRICQSRSDSAGAQQDWPRH